MVACLDPCSEVVRLSDGRRLAYSESGRPHGFPVRVGEILRALVTGAKAPSGA